MYDRFQLSTVHGFLQDAHKLMQLAGKPPFPGLISGVILRASNGSSITAAQDRFVQAAISPDDLPPVAEIRESGVAAAQQENKHRSCAVGPDPGRLHNPPLSGLEGNLQEQALHPMAGGCAWQKCWGSEDGAWQVMTAWILAELVCS